MTVTQVHVTSTPVFDQALIKAVGLTTTTFTSALGEGLLITCPKHAKHVHIVEDFVGGLATTGGIGKYGWRLTATNTTPTITVKAGEVEHPGIATFTPSTQTSAWMSLMLSLGSSNGAMTITVDNLKEWMWIFRCNAAPNKDIRIGMFNILSQDPTAGIYLEKLQTDADWQAVTRKSSTSVQRINTSVAYADNAWVNVYARKTEAGAWIFNMNNGTDLSNMTTELPTASTLLVAGLQITKQDGSQPTTDVDLFAAVGLVNR